MPVRRTRLTSLLGAAVALACAAALSPSSPAVADPGSVTVRQAYAVPASGSIPVTGKGYGHGHGLSQYGARGAARQGLDHARILAFYYPGTTLGKAAGQVRVRLVSDPDGQTNVPAQAGLKVRDVATRAVTALPATLAGARVTQWRMRTVSGRAVVEGYAGAWRVVARLGAVGAFFRDGAAAVTVRLPSGNRVYRGTVRHDRGLSVNVVPLDHLVRGVVAAEMPATWEPAAVRAQAVAARTYALFEREAHASRSYDTCDTTSCQVYGGLGAEHPRGNDAVAATAGQVLRYGAKAAFTQFSSSSGGWTSKGGQPYLVDREDPYDALSGNPNNPWRTTLTRARVQAAYPGIGRLERIVVTQRNGHGSWRGRVERLTLDGAAGDVVLTGSRFRSAFGLKSDWFAFG